MKETYPSAICVLQRQSNILKSFLIKTCHDSNIKISTQIKHWSLSIKKNSPVKQTWPYSLCKLRSTLTPMQNANANCSNNTDLVKAPPTRNGRTGISLSCSHFKLLNQAKMKTVAFRDCFFILPSKHSSSCQEEPGFKLILLKTQGTPMNRPISCI